ncbi:MAG: bifunctional N-acetylglucosamine-1-phosphate uridyltransferase/glucosamine-1-phosphate acetyltransferase [Caldilineales bacterium]|nr:bifunctional N-acetylglucosamine-1-phosphate uridyltransferase/glucosamine-1-phosphate acetyltransferase [Caldilineales bacterium]
MNLAVVILAAGKGTRMYSSHLPKVLHPLGGRPLVAYSVDLAARLTPDPPVLVIGHGGEQVQAFLQDRARYVLQAEQLGTGHALLQAEAALRDQADLVLVYAADMPLLTAASLRRLVAVHSQHPGPLTLLTVIAAHPRGFGRILRGEGGGEVLGIVEEAEATPAQRQIRELNAGVYCFAAEWLWPALQRLRPSPRKGEVYLTDLVQMAVEDGFAVHAVITEDETETLGINTRLHLAEAEATLRRRINQALLEGGVTMIDPATTYIQPDVVVEPDSVLWPGVCLLGRTQIGQGCEIGPHALLQDVVAGPGCYIGPGVVLRNQALPPGTRIEPPQIGMG